jgi:hypothetical protein
MYKKLKLSKATHNIFAHRIVDAKSDSCVEHSEDDGESQAGVSLFWGAPSTSSALFPVHAQVRMIRRQWPPNISFLLVLTVHIFVSSPKRRLLRMMQSMEVQVALSCNPWRYKLHYVLKGSFLARPSRFSHVYTCIYLHMCLHVCAYICTYTHVHVCVL